jgi:uncharacterized cupredoxin-like copper-binding protein
MGRRPLAWLVLGLVFAFLVVSILLQAVNKPTTSASSSGSAASPAQGTNVAGSAASGTTIPGGGNTQAGGGNTAAAGGPGTTIAATEKEYAIALDKSSVPAGNVTFDTKNAGSLPHTIAVTPGNGATKAQGITGKAIGDSGNIDPGKSGTLTVNLAPGTYQVVCSVPGHVQLGMIVQLTVT